MTKKTKVVESDQKNDQEVKTEQAPRDVAMSGTIDRVQFSPVDNLEKLARSGFCTERFQSNDLASPLFRLCCENLSENVEDLPTAVTPFMTAEQLADVVQGAVMLHPMIARVVQKKHPEGVEKVKQLEETK